MRERERFGREGNFSHADESDFTAVCHKRERERERERKRESERESFYKCGSLCFCDHCDPSHRICLFSWMQRVCLLDLMRYWWVTREEKKGENENNRKPRKESKAKQTSWIAFYRFVCLFSANINIAFSILIQLTLWCAIAMQITT